MDDKAKRVAMGRMIDAIRVMRSYHPHIESQTCEVFLEIARADTRDDEKARGIYMKDLASSVGIAQSSASRSIALLSKYLKHGTDGLEWVESFEDPMNRRQKTLRLTDKGKQVRDEVAGAIGG